MAQTDWQWHPFRVPNSSGRVLQIEFVPNRPGFFMSGMFRLSCGLGVGGLENCGFRRLSLVAAFLLLAV